MVSARRIICSIAAFSLCCLSAFAQYAGPRESIDDLYDTETVREMKSHVRFLASAALEGRKAGSEGEAEAAGYIAEKLQEYGVELFSPVSGDSFGVVRAPGDTLTSLNVTGLVKGWDSALNENYIVIGARLDGLGSDTYTVDGETVRRIYYGANGNASGLSMMLALAEKISLNRILFRRSVIFAAFGASGETLAGSWYFLNRAFPAAGKIDAMIDLDMVGGGGAGFYAYTSSNQDLDVVLDALRGELLPIHPEKAAAEPYSGDHRAFYDSGIPSVLLTSGQYPEHDTARDTYEILDFDKMERELEYAYALSATLANGKKPAFRPSEDPAGDTAPGVMSYSDVDVKPMFLNSADPRVFMDKWVYEYVKYPKYAVENGIQGRVMVDFVINEKGEVTDVLVSRSVHASLDEEAVRVVGASPKWRPGRHNGKKVKVGMTIPVEFRLEKRSDGSFGINGIKF